MGSFKIYLISNKKFSYWRVESNSRKTPENKTGRKISYYDPYRVQLYLQDCVFKRSKTSGKGWILCDKYRVDSTDIRWKLDEYPRIDFNPQKGWEICGEEIINHGSLPLLQTVNKEIYAIFPRGDSSFSEPVRIL